jgi:hypothetical protein
MPLEMEQIARLVEIDTELAKTRAEEKDLKEERRKIEEFLLNHLPENNIDKITVNGRTVFIRQSIKAAYTNKALATLALKKANLTDLVKEDFNANRLHAYVREQVQNGYPLPPELDGIIKPITIDQVSSIKST